MNWWQMGCLRLLSRKALRIRELSRAEKLLLFESFALVPAVSTLLRLLGFRRSLLILNRLARALCLKGEWCAGSGDAVAACRLVGIASRHGLSAATCLRQALVLWFLLRRRGVPADLRIGVRKNVDRLEAHAWIESDGRILDPTVAGSAARDLTNETAARFTKFDSLIESTG